MTQHDLNIASEFLSACTLSAWLGVVWVVLYLYYLNLKYKDDDDDA